MEREAEEERDRAVANEDVEKKKLNEANVQVAE